MWAKQAQLTLVRCSCCKPALISQLLMNLMLRKGLESRAAQVVRAEEMSSHAVHPLPYLLLLSCISTAWKIISSHHPQLQLNQQTPAQFTHCCLWPTQAGTCSKLRYLFNFLEILFCARSQTWAKNSKRRSRPSKETLLVITAPSQDLWNSAALSSSCYSVMDQCWDGRTRLLVIGQWIPWWILLSQWVIQIYFMRSVLH